MKKIKSKVFLNETDYIDFDQNTYFYLKQLSDGEAKVKGSNLQPLEIRIIRCLCAHYGEAEGITYRGALFNGVYGHPYRDTMKDETAVENLRKYVDHLRRKGALKDYIVIQRKSRESLLRIVLHNSPFEQNVIDDGCMADHKEAYIQKYLEPFILHKRDGLVSLSKGVYVSPDCEFSIYQERYCNTSINLGCFSLMDKMKDLLNEDQNIEESIENEIYPKPNVFLLLGHGASGKTSFVTMASTKSELLLQEKNDLRVLMLRRFADVPSHRLSEAIVNALPNMNSKTTIILDGLDELFMMHGDLNPLKAAEIFQKICQVVLGGNRKLIITSRPGVLDPDEVWQKISSDAVVYGMVVGTIYTFNHKQRTEFVRKIQEADPSLVDRVECEWICELKDDNEIDKVYSTPFFIYLMVASSKARSVAQRPISDLERTNKWALFRRLFHDIYFDSDYWENGEISKNRGIIKRQKEKMYIVSQHVAWKIYSNNSNRYYCTVEELKEIVENLGYEEELLNEIVSFFPVSSYINRDGHNNAYEFSHNYIRDFFLCEFLLNNIEKAVSEDNAKLQIIRFAMKYLYPHNIRKRAYGIQYHGGHWILQFIKDYCKYYHLSGGDNCPYINIMSYPTSAWNVIFYNMYHGMVKGTLSSKGTEYNQNVFNNIKYIYLSLFPFHDSIDSTVNMPTDEQKKKIFTITQGSKVTFGLSEWFVLDIEGDFIKLISSVGFTKMIHELSTYSYSINNITWNNSTLRAWLNHDFFVNFFANFERLAITHGKEADPVSLLTVEEVQGIEPWIITEIISNTHKTIEKSIIPHYSWTNPETMDTAEANSKFNMTFPHPSAAYRIIATDGILRSVSRKWDAFRYETSMDVNKYGLVFPVIKLYYSGLSSKRTITEK